MKYSHNWLKEFVPKLPPPEKLAGLIARHAFEVEGIEKAGTDTILDIAILTNRMPDAAGHIGFAREVAAITKLSGKFPNPPPLKAFGKKFLDVTIANGLSSRYHGALVAIKVQPSPKWLRERLHALGVHSINNVVDITNYVMLESGHPLHAFDYSKIRGKRLRVRLSREGEALETLDDARLTLPKGVIVIDDAERAIDLAGIMGGANSAVNSRTRTIFLQAAHFSQTHIHRASVVLGKRTDAALRYASGLDPDMAGTALVLAVELLRELADSHVLGVIDWYPQQVLPARILFHPEKANAILGTVISEKEMRRIFARLGFGVEVAPRGVPKGSPFPNPKGYPLKRTPLGAVPLIIVVPTARRDIQGEEDLIEEIGRFHGYDAIREERPRGELASASTDIAIAYRDRVLGAFRAAGFDEARTYSFIGDREAAFLDGGAHQSLIELENPQSNEATRLRPSILPSLLGAAATAAKFTSRIRYCEMSRVFRFPDRIGRGAARDTTDFEENRLAFIAAEKTGGKRGALFYELKGALDSIMESLGLPDGWYDDVPSSSAIRTQDIGRLLHPYQAAQIKIGDTLVGMVGTLHPDVRRAFDIPMEAAVGELYLDAFEKELEREKEYRAIPKYPAVLRDLAILVPKNIRMTDVEDVIQAAGGALLADADLFDVFEGDDPPAGRGADRKSLAFHLIFQSEERTLTDLEVEKIMKKIASALEADPEWEVR